MAVPPFAGVPFDPTQTDVVLANLTLHVHKRHSTQSAPPRDADEAPAQPPVQQAPSPAPSAGGAPGGGAQSQPLFSPVCGQPLPASQRMSFGALPGATAEPTPAAVRPSMSPAVASVLRPNGFLTLGRTIAGGISPALAVDRSGGGPFGASPAPAFGAPRDLGQAELAAPMDVSATAAAAAINAAAVAPPPLASPPGGTAPASQVEGLYVVSQQGQPLSMPDPSADILPSHARTTHSLGGPTQALGEASSAHTVDVGGTQLVLDDDTALPVASAMAEAPGATQVVPMTEPVPDSQAGGPGGGSMPPSPNDGEPAPYNPPFMVVPPAVDLWSDSQLVSQPPPGQQQHQPPVLAAVPEEEPADVAADEVQAVEPEVIPASVEPHLAASPALGAAVPADVDVVEEARAVPEASDSDATRDEPAGGGTALVDDASGGVSLPAAAPAPEEEGAAVEAPLIAASQPPPEAAVAAASPQAALAGDAPVVPSQPVGEVLSPPAALLSADVAGDGEAAPQVVAPEAGGPDPYDSDVTVDESPRAGAESTPAPAEPAAEAEPSPAAVFSLPVDQPLQLRDSTAGHDTASPPVESGPHQAAELVVAPEAAPEPEPELAPLPSVEVAAAPLADVEAAVPASGGGASSQPVHVASMLNSTQVPVDSQMQAGAWDNVGAFYDHTQLPLGGTPPPPPPAAPAARPDAVGGGGETQLAVDDLEEFMARASKEASDEPAQPVPSRGAAAADGGGARRKGVTPRRRGAPSGAPEAPEAAAAAPPVGCETQVAADTVADMMAHAQDEAPAAPTGRAGRKSKASTAAAPTPVKEAAAGTPAALPARKGRGRVQPAAEEPVAAQMLATQEVPPPAAAAVAATPRSTRGGKSAKAAIAATPVAGPRASTRGRASEVTLAPAPAPTTGARGVKRGREAEAAPPMEAALATQDPAVAAPDEPATRGGNKRRQVTPAEPAPKAAAAAKKTPPVKASARSAPKPREKAPPVASPPPPPPAAAKAKEPAVKAPQSAAKGTKRPAAAMASPPSASTHSKRHRGSADADAAAPATATKAAATKAAAGPAPVAGPARVQVTSRMGEADAAALRGLVKPIKGMTCLPADKHSSLDFTHFVVDPATGVQRTRNVLACLAAGRPIVSPAWVTACAKAGAQVECHPYLVRDKDAERKFGFELPASLAAARTKPLLAGQVLYALKGSEDVCAMLCDVAPLAGARVVKKLSAEVTIVIGTTGKGPLEKEHAAAKAANKTVHDPEWLMNALMRQTLPAK